MYSYSPIKTIQVKNFRNIGDSTFDFSDSPIISLIGENESGKTSVVKAFGVCAMHTDPRSQKDYIRDGTNGFGVAITLEDGTQVIRMKTAGMNKYTVKYPDGKVWDAQKLENEVPKAVQEVMGLIDEPETKELIHIRTYEDQLLFVVTPASTNYKVMYNALKISQITKAIKAGSTEANSLKAKITSADNSISTLQHSISTIRLFDLEPLLNVKQRLAQESSTLSKLDSVVQLIDNINAQERELGALALIGQNNLSEIPTYLVEKLNRVESIVNEIKQSEQVSQSYLELSNIEPVDVVIFSKLNEAREKKSSLEEMMRQSKNYIALGEITTISPETLVKLDRVLEVLSSLDRLKRLDNVYSSDELVRIEDRDLEVINTLDKIVELYDEINKSNKWMVEANRYIDGVINWMKSIGVATTTCPNCGESVIIDLDLVNKPQETVE